MRQTTGTCLVCDRRDLQVVRSSSEGEAPAEPPDRSARNGAPAFSLSWRRGSVASRFYPAALGMHGKSIRVPLMPPWWIV